MNIYTDLPDTPPAYRHITVEDRGERYQVRVKPTNNLKFFKGKLHQWHTDEAGLRFGVWLPVESE